MSDEAILLKLLGRTEGTADGSNEPYVDHDRTHLVIDGHFTLTDAEATRVAQLLATSKEQCPAAVRAGATLIVPMAEPERAGEDIRCVARRGHKGSHYGYFSQPGTGPAQVTWDEHVEEPPHRNENAMSDEYPTCSLPPCEEPGVECFDYPLRISSTLTLAAPAWLCEQHQRQFPWTRQILDLGDIDAPQ